MRKIISVVLILILFLIGGCKPSCNKPYLLVGNNCCLDQNNNDICDSDEKQEESPKANIEETSASDKESSQTTKNFDIRVDSIIKYIYGVNWGQGNLI